MCLNKIFIIQQHCYVICFGHSEFSKDDSVGTAQKRPIQVKLRVITSAQDDSESQNKIKTTRPVANLSIVRIGIVFHVHHPPCT